MRWECGISAAAACNGDTLPSRKPYFLTFLCLIYPLPWREHKTQEMTASEPLSLEEEYAMQLSWKEDPKKCTFIVLALAGVVEGESHGKRDEDPTTTMMAGDVNLFFNDYDDPGMCEVL